MSLWLWLLGLVALACLVASGAMVHAGWKALHVPRVYVVCARCGEKAGEVITRASYHCRICRRTMHHDFALYAAKLLWTGERDERDVIDRAE